MRWKGMTVSALLHWTGLISGRSLGGIRGRCNTTLGLPPSKTKPPGAGPGKSKRSCWRKERRTSSSIHVHIHLPLNLTSPSPSFPSTSHLGCLFSATDIVQNSASCYLVIPLDKLPLSSRLSFPHEPHSLALRGYLCS